MSFETATPKFIGFEDARIRLGFAHIGLEQIALSMGWGKDKPTYHLEVVTSDKLLTWDGRPGAQIGWLVRVY
jgi:hypothetical protein